MMKRPACVSAMVITATLTLGFQAGPPLSAQGQDVTTLQGETPVQRQLARGEEHRYIVALDAGEYARVVVEQQGIDIVAQLRGTDDAVIAEFADEMRRHAEEPVDIVADVAGTYVIAVKPALGVVEPGSYAIRLAAHRTATDADRTIQESRKLRTRAVRLEKAGKFEDARPLFARALTLAEPLAASNAAYVAVLTFQSAGNAVEMHDDPGAQALYERAIAMMDKVWGTEHPYPAMARSRLALLYQHAGQGPRAEALLRESLEVLERTLGTNHLWYAQCLTTQAALRYDAGDLNAAETLDRRAMAILEHIQNTESIQYAGLLNNLGEIYRQRNDNKGAEELYLRALAVAERLYGPDSYRVSTTLGNLGIVAREQKEYARALDYDTRALSMRERILGPDHPDLAPLLNNLAVLYRVTGDDARGLAMHFRTLEIWERSVGPYHRGTLTSVGNIARMYAAMGDTKKAIEFERRADAIVERQLALNLAAGSERQKLAFVRSVSDRTDRTLSLSLDQAPGDADAASLAALVLLQRKGRVQDAMIDAFAAVRQHVSAPADRDLLDQLNETSARLAQVALRPADNARWTEQQQSFAALEARKDQIEITLSEHSAEFRARMQPVTLEAVQHALPPEAALLEFAVFHPFDPKAERNADAYSAPHYAGYVVRQHGAPVGVDLGAATSVDYAIDAFRNALRDPADPSVRVRARALDERVMQPLRRALGDATRLLISPDGDLNLVPFEALVDEHDHYLIERYAVSYLTSGRDLLRMQVPRAAPTAPVIVADPLFGEPTVTASARPPQPRPAARPARRSVTTTGTEARAIKGLFPDATLLIGSQATKAMLEHVHAPLLLHIASHGFFLQDSNAVAGGGNPLLRSGIAFAGANLTRHGQDGILTALEASGLDLWGTKLVTLSACDTGIGEVRNGEGVYGLRRAFVLAGTETLVMSLWPVSDSISREAMVAYYTGLRSGLGRGDALRQAKLAMLKRHGRQHPFYWASFIQSGQWASLDAAH
jgi:CHAT domain-containing protein